MRKTGISSKVRLSRDVFIQIPGLIIDIEEKRTRTDNVHEIDELARCSITLTVL
jgi:hypothetical protein